MTTIAYLANQYPNPMEPYVGDEIQELRQRGIQVIPGSVWRPRNPARDTLYVMPVGLRIGLWAAWTCLWRCDELKDLLWRVLLEGHETAVQRAKALVHTWLGACYALRLRKHGVQHIHVHHGYFAAWVATVASRLTGASVSMTLHGSDLLRHATFMDAKLANCKRCFPISEFNRQHILARYSEIPASKVVVTRLGVPASRGAARARGAMQPRHKALRMLCVGRLHPVKGHQFLVSACAELRRRGVALECRLAGGGPERRKLQRRIQREGLEDSVKLLGHVAREKLGLLYDWADVVVLTSESEGIPVVLMEAMARGKIVIAPAITGIPELVRNGETGFLYTPGSLSSFVERTMLARACLVEMDGDGRRGVDDERSVRLEWMRHAARVHVRLNFDQQTNLKYFAGLLESAARRPARIRA